MKIVLLTNEAPPHIYGGAGVHVDFLSREVARLEENRHSIEILCFGNQDETAGQRTIRGIPENFPFPTPDPRHQKLFDALYRNLIMAGLLKDADLVHCHTWYTHLAGCLVKSLLGIPLVLTTHSLEPHRPWKEEQLGAGYQVSSWVEKTAYGNADGVIAVSAAMKDDVQDLYGVPPEKIRVIHNGIDTERYKPTFNPEVLLSYGINPDEPFLLFVGRITLQKGIIHLVNSIKYLNPGIQIVLCAGAPDTEEIGREMEERVEEARKLTPNRTIWIRKWVPTAHLIPLYSHASLFVCPSIYEPFGLINVEAMACATPVVASAVGGIKEVVVHGETGLLVPFESESMANPEPKHPEQFSRDLAAAINLLLESSDRIERMKKKARERMEKNFSWPSIASKTLQFYKDLVSR